LLLILSGVISERDALKSIDLKTIFLFGGTLSLAAALQKTGAGEMIAEKVIGALGADPSPYLLTLVVFLLCCVMTNFMSNTATTALLVPICLCNPDRNAGKYHGCGSRRLSLYGFCKSRISIDYHSNGCEYDHPSDCISILSIKG